MKIALYIAHEGLMRMFLALWKEHEVRISSKWEGADGLKPEILKGNEDIIVSTIPHNELNRLNTDKPVIAYITNPIYPTARPGFALWKDRKNFIAIGTEHCYPEELVVPVSYYIPYAMKNYPSYNGMVNKILVVNRNADDRLMEITSGALYGHMSAEEKVYDVKKLMGDLPYTLAKEPNPSVFRQMYADYKVLFYFSTSPFTCVMFEAMKVGIPIVAYESAIGSWTSVIEKYFSKRSIFPEEIRKMLQEELDKPVPEKVIYPFPSFESIKVKWNNLFEKMLNV